jgi:O-antigen/teichoic acid export membrane protein
MKKLTDTREKRATLNIIVSLFCQCLTLICGLIVPKLMIETFGSEAYGATASIAQFLAYIALLEGGIGGVARAALYKPLAENNIQVISEIVNEITRFFRIIAYIFTGYVLVLACGFYKLSHIECFDWLNTFLLVIVISISTFAQYFIGISYSVLIQAAQKTYITNIVNIFTIILNTILIIILIKLKSNLILVKLVSSCVFVLRPIILYRYVFHNFKILTPQKNSCNYLSQKWDGLGQHIAYFLYYNTDIAILTIFYNLKAVAVYSVYNMVISQVYNLTTSFSTGMEAFFGELIAKNECEELHKVFGYYENLISLISLVMFSSTAVLIMPFIQIYTKSVEDVNYIEPLFAILFILSTLITCLRSPYHNLTIAAGHFKQTQWAAYGEAFINIILSAVLVINLGLVGVVIGTLIATAFRMLFYAFYLTTHIFNRKIQLFIKREFVNIGMFFLIFIIGRSICNVWDFSGYGTWIICAIIVTLIAIIISFLGNYICYRNDFKLIIK